MNDAKKRNLIYLILFFTILYIVSIFIVFRWNVTPEVIQGWILGYGYLAPAAYVVTYIIFILFPVLPNPPLVVASGLAFGLAQGFLLSFVSSVIAYTLTFSISRKYGKTSVTKFVGKTGMDEVEKLISRVSTKEVFFLRLVPGFSFDLFSYAVGLGNMKLGNFLFALSIPTALSLFVTVAIGDFSIRFPSMMFVLFGISLMGFMILSFFAILRKEVSKD